MTGQLSDEQLIELVQSRDAEDFTPEEIERLRERLAASDELRFTLFERLHLESRLHAVLGDVNVSVDDIVSRAAQLDRPARWKTLWPLGLGFALLVMLSGGAWLLSRDASRAGSGEGESEGALAAAAGPEDSATSSTGGGSEAPGEQPATGDADTRRPVSSPRPIVLEAEEFMAGNLLTGRAAEGESAAMVRSTSERPSFAEYRFSVPVAGIYQLESRYAANEPRPVTLQIDDQKIRADAAREVTGGWTAETLGAFVEARVRLSAGEHLLRLERDGPVPHLDKLALVPVPSASTVQFHWTQRLPLMVLAASPVAASNAGTGAPNAESPPWLPALSPEAPVLRAADAAFVVAQPGLPRMQLRSSELNRWLRPVSSGSFRVEEKVSGKTLWTRFEGLAELAAPWPNDAALQLGLFDSRMFELHFWNGAEGVTLRWTVIGNVPRLAAMLSRRMPGTSRPQTQSLVATDSGILARSGNGPVSIQHTAGTLVVSRGSVRLLTVPLANPPETVILEGTASLAGLWMVRREPPPAPVPPERPSVIATGGPAHLDWITGPEQPVRLVTDPGGSVELEYDAHNPQPARQVLWAGTPLPRAGLYEVTVCIERPEPGTGLYLGDAQGQPVHHIAFFRDRESGRTAFGFGWSRYGYGSQGNVREEIKLPDPAALPAWAAETCWLRIVTGPGGLKLSVSADGSYWSHALNAPVREAHGASHSVGVFVLGGRESRRIRLSQLAVRELTGVTSLADASLRNRVPPLPGRSRASWTRWTAHMLQSCPSDVPLDVWRRTVAVQTLAQGLPPVLASRLLEELLQDGLDLPLQQHSLSDKFLLLHDVAALADLYEPKQLVALTAGYARVAELSRWRGEAASGTRTLQLLFEAPVWTAVRMPPVPVDLLRASLLGLLNRRDWSLARQTAREFRFWLTPSSPAASRHPDEAGMLQWIDWVDSVAASRMPRAEDLADTAYIPRSWRHPLVVRVSREGYNVMAELEAALAGAAWQDACQIIAAAPAAAAGSGTVGMLPDARDSELLVSLQNKIALAMQDNPDLGTVMRESFGQSGLLHVREAIGRGDHRALQAATIRYYGTEAAGEAHRFLGDRALSSGRFAQAVEFYRRALPAMPQTTRAETRNRLLLAESLIAGDGSRPPAADVPQEQEVVFGSQSLSGNEFVKLVAEVQQRTAGRGPRATAVAAGSADGPRQIPRDAPLEVESRLPVELKRAALPADSRGIDHLARQLSISSDAELVCLSDGIVLRVCNVADGRLKYTVDPGGDTAGAGEWRHVATRPLLSGERIFWRRLIRQRPQVLCVERAGGKVLWQSDLSAMLVSDPLLVRNRLVAVTAQPVQSDRLQLELVTFDQASGEVVGRQSILTVRDQWSGRPPVAVAQSQGRIVLALDGLVAGVDLLGRPEWVRTLPRVPQEIDGVTFNQPPEPPLFDGDRVFVAPQRSRTVMCLQLATGRLLWSSSVSGLQRIAGVTAGRVIVLTGHGLQALQADNGRAVWSGFLPSEAGEALCHAGAVLASRPVPGEGGKQIPGLTWFDAADGAPRADVRLTGMTGEQPAISNLHLVGRSVLAVAAGEQAARERTLLTLRPRTVEKGGPGLSATGRTLLHRLRQWQSGALSGTQAELDALAPDWFLLSLPVPGPPEQAASASPLVLRAPRGEMLLLAGHAPPVVPASAALHLDLRLPPDAPANAEYVVTVIAGGRPAGEPVVLTAEAPRLTHSVPLAGRNAADRWILVTVEPRKPGSDFKVMLSRLELTSQ